ncbi:hypothetical protein [Hoeflea sp. BAL378]|uniref:hypothetical protein n=1 Tax=Hoeflea sp. BAL378 TaxID=1547437 RepID=UPI00126A0D8B|nr:hypothetical protein [Hoeflea sp. BAL378]
MVKKHIKGNGTSRIRFIMIEAEMPEGDLTQIANAIQNALRPASVSGPKLPKTPVQIIGLNEQDDDDEEVVDASVEEDDATSVGRVLKAAASKPRRPAKRKVVDIELSNEISLKSYTENYPPKNDQDRYLVVVAFLCEHRKEIEGVNADHVYTCFRKLEWPTGSKDFGQPLRNLKLNQLLDPGPGRGTYVINHIGIDKVHKLAEG